MAGLVWFLAVIGFSSGAFAEALPTVVESGTRVTPQSVGLVVNTQDPLSRDIGDYYRKAYDIPHSHVFEVDFPVGGQLNQADFERQYKALVAATPDTVQAYALAFWQPYKVGCMSITTAFTFGYDQRFCASGCRTTRYSPYFNSSSHTPWSDHKIRPSMAIAARSLAEAKKLIDRGKASRQEWPDKSSGFVMKTSDTARSVRGMSERDLERLNRSDDLEFIQEKGNELRGVRRLMFYFTGLAQVPSIERNIYLPGAVADHLTSFGGVLDGTGQMSALRWLEAGATGSYGTVTEPCNFTAKFPNPTRLIDNYRRGDTLVEAYWKSVAMPGQGIFIGDPLARPWGGFRVTRDDGLTRIESPSFYPGTYEVEASETHDGPFTLIGRAELPANDRFIDVNLPERSAFLRINRLAGASVKLR